MDLLVIGGSGYLGREVVRQASHLHHRVTATFHSHGLHGHRPGPHGDSDGPHGPGAGKGRADVRWRQLDIRRRDDVAALAATVGPQVIVNAAYRQSDWATTAIGGMHVASAAAAVRALLVHVSSDAVFSGTAPCYDESCLPDPTTPYGAAKAAAETAATGLVPAAVIARTSLIVGDGASSHERQVHALAAGTATGVMFTDDIRCPVHVADLAAALLELASEPRPGVHHLAGPDAVSRHELGVLIARRDGLDQAALPTGLRAGSGLPGPIVLRLNGVRTQARLTTRLRGAREFLTGPAPASP